MVEFRKRLNEASAALILLSKEYEQLETQYSDILAEDYPFNVCLLEVIHGMLVWQESINKYMEAMRLGETTNS